MSHIVQDQLPKVVNERVPMPWGYNSKPGCPQGEVAELGKEPRSPDSQTSLHMGDRGLCLPSVAYARTRLVSLMQLVVKGTRPSAQDGVVDTVTLQARLSAHMGSIANTAEGAPCPVAT